MAGENPIITFMSWNVSGIPVAFVVMVSLAVLLFYFIFTRNPKEKEFKKLEMRKAVKEDMDFLYKYFSDSVGKNLYSGFTPLGHVLGYMPLFWQMNLNLF